MFEFLSPRIRNSNDEILRCEIRIMKDDVLAFEEVVRGFCPQ